MMGTKRKRTTLKADIFEEIIADDVKKDIDIIRLFNDFGVNLTKKGNGYIGLCPFHDDKNPSLSVDKTKGLFNCFGCGESGDVITLIQKIKGFNFKESMNYLKTWKNGVPSDLSIDFEEPVLPKDKELIEDIRKPEDIIPTINSQQSHNENQNDKAAKPKSISLTDIITHYHKQLYTSKKAIEYLEGRGLKNKELYQRSKLGFADGSIMSMISENGRNELKELGIINEYDYETFNNCLIFPILNENEQVVGVYGRNITEKAKVKHFYLKGKHKGVFNFKVSKIYDEVILTECIIDALSLIESGIENVQSAYGVNGFTDEHFNLLKADRVKTVVIAFDNDEPGIKASGKIKDRLLNEGFIVKEIRPEETKDWNESLLNGLTKDTVLNLIANAEAFKYEEEEKENFKAEVLKTSHLFTIGDVVYHVTGVKDIFVTNLRVHMKIEYEGSHEHDNLDLYSARSRGAFSANMGRKLNIV